MDKTGEQQINFARLSTTLKDDAGKLKEKSKLKTIRDINGFVRVDPRFLTTI